MIKYLILLHTTALSIACYAQEKPLVVASATVFIDMAKQIGGDQFRYASIVPAGGDPHTYDPTPRDARLCAQADLILRNGLTFEGWIDRLIANAGSRAPVVTITDGITPIASVQYANAYDPHAWMDASNGKVYARNIRDALIALSPDVAHVISNGYENYISALEAVDAYIMQKIRTIPEERRVLITSHDAFQYFGRRYGLRLESVLGTSTDADIQTADIIRINRVIATTRVPAVFIESTVNPRMLEQIAKDNRVAIGGELYSDSLSDQNGPAPTYIDMLRYNTDTIVEALTTEHSGDPVPGSKISWWWVFLLLPVLLGIFYFLLTGKTKA